MPTITKNDDIDDENNIDYNDIYNDTVYIISGSKSELEHELEHENEIEHDATINTLTKRDPMYYQFVSYVKHRVPTRLENLHKIKSAFFNTNHNEIETIEFNDRTVVDNLNPSNSSVDYVIQNINTAYAYVLENISNEIIEANNTIPNSVAMECVIQNINTAYAYVLEKYDDFNEKK